MSSDPVTSEPQQRGERSSHTGSVADSEQVSIAMLVSMARLNNPFRHYLLYPRKGK